MMQKKVVMAADRSDELTTSIMNRRWMLSRLNQAVSWAASNQSKLVVILVTLHEFQRICETKGYAFGDELFRAISRICKPYFGEGTELFRTAEDKFVFWMEPFPYDDQAKAAIDYFLQILAQPVCVGATSVTFTVSIGVTLFPQDAGTAEELFQRAEMAVRAAKESGHNKWRHYSPSMSDSVMRRQRLADDLPHALDRQQLSLHYQPQFETAFGNIRGFEALLRWNHPELGSIPPTEFIPIAEETGVIHSLGQWVIQTAFEKNKQIQDEYLADSIMSVNVSGVQLQDPLFCDRVLEMIRQTGLCPQYVELELTEYAKISFTRQAVDGLHRLTDQGIRIALDDFGTEYASLAYVTTLPLSSIKIDRAFVADIARRTDRSCVAEWIVSLAKRLGFTVIAEGVESYEQLHSLLSWECDCVQGYLVSKPLSDEELPHFFRKFQWKKEKKLHG